MSDFERMARESAHESDMLRMTILISYIRLALDGIARIRKQSDEDVDSVREQVDLLAAALDIDDSLARHYESFIREASDRTTDIFTRQLDGIDLAEAQVRRQTEDDGA
jgi:hypothetical protein